MEIRTVNPPKSVSGTTVILGSLHPELDGILVTRVDFAKFVYISYVVKQRYQIKYTNFWLAFFKNPQNFIFGLNYQKYVFECRILLRF